MAQQTFVLHGYTELMRALKQMDTEERRYSRAVFRETGEAVKRQSAATMSPIDTKTAAGYKVGVTQRSVRVYQSVRKVTGKHPEYGGYQMRHALIPALRDKEPETERALEHALDVIADHFEAGP